MAERKKKKAGKKRKNPEELGTRKEKKDNQETEKERMLKEKRRRKIFGKDYDYYTKGKTEEEILDAELFMTDTDEWARRALKEGRLLLD